MSHLDPGLLHELLDGEIPSADLAPIQAHLASCEECRARLEYERQLQSDADGLVAAIELPQAAPPRVSRALTQRSRSSWLSGLAWAASLILAVGLGYLARGPGSAPAAHRESVAAAGTSGAQAIPPTVARSDTAVGIATRQAAPAEHVTVPAAREGLALQQQKTDTRAFGGAASASRRDVRDQAAAKSAAGALAANQPAAGTVAATARAQGRIEDHPPPATKLADSLPRPTEPVRGAAPAPVQPSRSLDNTRSVNALVPRDALMATQQLENTVTAGVPITLSEAVRRLGGTLRLIDGLVPLRLELREPYVRVVYPAAQGELVLQQQLIDGRVVFQIIPPRGFPADSLARLRAKVKE
jgi:hypothetical protein